MSAEPRGIGRSWRRFVRRMGTTRATLIVVGVVAVMAVVVALVVRRRRVVEQHAPRRTSTTAPPTAVDQASTAAPGVTATTIRVVFPIVSLNSLAGREGFAADTEYG